MNMQRQQKKPRQRRRQPLKACRVCGSTSDLMSYGLPDKFLCKAHTGEAVRIFGWQEPLDED